MNIIDAREYTDLAVVIGPDVRWTEEDVADLQREFPEVLLGYRVVLATVADVNEGWLRGMRPRKFIVLEGCSKHRDYARFCEEVFVSALTSGADVETWDVHRSWDGLVVKRVDSPTFSGYSGASSGRRGE